MIGRKQELRTRVVHLCPVADVTNHGGHGGGHTRDHTVPITWQSHARSDLAQAPGGGPGVRVPVKFLYASGSTRTRFLNTYHGFT